MADHAAIVGAWAATRWAMTRVCGRAALERRQARLWQAMAPVLRATPALAGLAGRPLAEVPVTDAATMRADFDRWNSRSIREADALAAAHAAEAGEAALLPGGIAAGLSTGSSGRRGLFLASPAERARYVGQALARLLGAGALLTGRRIALCLRADNALYRDVGEAGRFAFRFVPLALPAEERAALLRRFDPHILIAPPHVLADLARSAVVLPALERVYYGAEPLGEAERGWIAGRLGIRPDPIYQATEGFLGAACRLGVLHLNEHDMVVELEPVPGTDRFRPIVTDLRRATQPIVRIRIDDLIEPIVDRCACGAVTRAIRPVEGRVGDLWCWGDRTICPRQIEDALAAALGADADWRATAGPAGIVVEAADGPRAVEALANLLHRSRQNGDDATFITVKPFAGHGPGPKRRRVRWDAADG